MIDSLKPYLEIRNFYDLGNNLLPNFSIFRIRKRIKPIKFPQTVSYYFSIGISGDRYWSVKKKRDGEQKLLNTYQQTSNMNFQA